MLDGCVPWPEEFARRYREAGYWRGERLGDLVRPWARRTPGRTALVGGDIRWSYEELDTGADRLAAGLAARGMTPGDRVVVQLPNVPELIVLSLALFRLGALPVFALPAHRESELRHLWDITSAGWLVVPDRYVGTDHRELARALPVPDPRRVLVAGEAEEFEPLAAVDADPVPLPAPDPADVALFLLSGGTTGLPKLIPRTHQDYVYNLRASAENARLTPDDVYLAVLPAAHNYALACPGVLGALLTGGTAVLSPTPGLDDTFPLIERERVTVTGLVPPLALLWTDAAPTARADLSSLRLVQVGGAKFGAEAARAFGPALGCALQQSFGMGEGLLSQSRPDDPPEVVETAQGRPLSPADEIRVVDARGRDVAPGETGELLTRGPYTIRGYYRAEEYNATAFTPDGFLRTGDLVRLTPRGDLVVEGRLKDQINRGGDKVAAEELENHLLAHPRIHDCAAVGLPDAMLGERVCVFVVPRDGDQGPGKAEAVRFLRERGVAGFKLPDRLERVDTLPRTAVGKIDKERLRDTLTGRAGTEATS